MGAYLCWNIRIPLLGHTPCKFFGYAGLSLVALFCSVVAVGVWVTWDKVRGGVGGRSSFGAVATDGICMHLMRGDLPRGWSRRIFLHSICVQNVYIFWAMTCSRSCCFSTVGVSDGHTSITV